MAVPPLERLLTQLSLGPAPSAAELDALAPLHWAELDRRAQHYRLQPLLHHRWAKQAAIPAQLRAGWAAAYRASALSALAHKAELVRICNRLHEDGIGSVALKGAWLAWHAWPDAALRPLRDLDLLVAEEAVLDARAILLGEGFVELGTEGLSAETWKSRFHHLPALLSPGGVHVELHQRLWVEDRRTPALPTGLFARAQADRDHPAILYPDPVDQLLHLSVHAALHMFDGGPLMLADLVQLARSQSFDWPAVWQRARAEGWERVAALAIAAARRWSDEGALYLPEPPAPAAPSLVESLPLLLAKPPERIAADQTAMRLARGDIGWGEKLRRALKRRERYDSWLGWARWLAGEARHGLAALSGGTSGAGAALVARLNRYLAQQGR